MAQRWVPDPAKPVEPTETIGRRLFNEPKLAGAADQKKPAWFHLELTHFEDSRPELSLDRVGRSGSPDGKVVKFLDPKAQDGGRAFTKPKRFDGWATVRAKDLITPRKGPRFPITVSAIRFDEPEHKEHNPYHAHLADTGLDSYLRALSLRQIFESYGGTVPSKSKQGKWPLWTWRLKTAIEKFFGK